MENEPEGRSVRGTSPGGGFLKSPTEMTGALVRKHLQKGEERADFKDALEEKWAVLVFRCLGVANVRSARVQADLEVSV